MLVSDREGDGTSTGSDQGPVVEFDHAIQVESGAWARHCWSLGHEGQEVPLTPQAHGGLHCDPGASSWFEVKNMTHSPVGARDTVGLRDAAAAVRAGEATWVQPGPVLAVLR